MFEIFHNNNKKSKRKKKRKRKKSRGGGIGGILLSCDGWSCCSHLTAMKEASVRINLRLGSQSGEMEKW